MEQMSEEMRLKFERKKKIYRVIRRTVVTVILLVLVYLLIDNVPIPRHIKATYTGYIPDENLERTSDETYTLELNIWYKNYLLRKDGDDAFSGTIKMTPFKNRAGEFWFDTRGIQPRNEERFQLPPVDKWYNYGIAIASFTTYEDVDFFHYSMYFNRDFTFILLADNKRDKVYYFHSDKMTHEEAKELYDNMIWAPPTPIAPEGYYD